MDFEILKQQIEEAAKKAFLEVYEKHGAEEIYCFALYSDEGAMTVCPAANTMKVMEDVDEDDALYYKYEPAEWTYEMEGADKEFNDICTQLRAENLTDMMTMINGLRVFRLSYFSPVLKCWRNLKMKTFSQRSQTKIYF